MRARINPALRNATEIERLRKDFDHFDRDADGRMAFEEFVRFLDAVGAGLSRADCEQGFREIDSDHDGVIGFEEFRTWWGVP